MLLVVGWKNLALTLNQDTAVEIDPKIITDFDFANNIGLLSNTTEQAQILLNEVENAALQVGLHIRPSVCSLAKIKMMTYKH